MRIEGTLTESDYVQAQFLFLRSRRGLMAMLLLLFAFMFLVNDNLLLPIGAIILFFIVMAVMIPMQARRAFRSYKALSEPIVVEVRPEGLFMKRERGEGTLPWDHIYRWRRNRHLILIQPGRNLTYILPRHFFDSDASYEQFAAVLSERIDGKG